jgi:hypothetical protein
LDVVARECDRFPLSKAQRFAGDVRRALLRLLEAPGRALPERLREAAERVVRLLEEPSSLYLAYYPVTPGEVEEGKVTRVAVAFYVSFVRRFPAGPRAAGFIVLVPPSRLATDPELRYALAHELAHAAGRGEEEAAGLADALKRHFPMDFDDPAWCVRKYVQRGGSVVDWLDFGMWLREHEREFHDALFYCSEELKPVQG